ncbi:hypothetical protein JTE90_018881, partial [Oedothorax gibbosus]
MFCVDYGIVNNPGDHPTYHLQGRFGCPDLTIASNLFIEHVCGWAVDLTESCSDHRFIRFQIRADIVFKRNSYYDFAHYSPLKARRKFKELEYELVSLINNCGSVQDIDMALNQFYAEIDKTCKFVFKRKKSGGRGSLKWWNSELNVFRKRIKALYLKHIRTGTLSDKIFYYIEMARYKSLINMTKLSSWRAFCEGERDRFGSIFNTIMSKNRGSSLVTATLEGSDQDSDFRDTYTKLVEHHFSITSETVVENAVLTDSHRPITKAELGSAV